MRRRGPSVPSLLAAAVLAGTMLCGCADVTADDSGTSTGRRIDAGPTTSTGLTVAVPPGADDDLFCAGWLDYATTVRILVSLTLDSTDDGARRLAEVELLSARSMEEAVNAIGAHWPPALVGERSAVLADVVGPYLRRAQKALAAMADAGLSGGDTAELRLVWRDVLLQASRTPSSPASSWLDRAAVPAHLHDAVRAAAAAFAAAVTAFGDDPTLRGRETLVDPIDTPRTDAFLAVHCPGVADVATGIEF